MDYAYKMLSASYGKVLYNAFIEYENLINNGPVGGLQVKPKVNARNNYN